MSTLVTGSAGFIGRHVKRALPGALGFDAVVNEEDVTKWVPTCDITIHLAALAGLTECKSAPMRAFDVNVRGTMQVLEAAKRHIDARVVFASSAAAANPTNPYAASKRSAELWCETYRHSYGVKVSVLRLANVYGPGSMHKNSVVAAMCKSAIEDGCIIVHGDGTQCRDFVHVDDVVTALTMEHTRPLQVVGTGKLTPINEIADHIAILSGAEIVWEYWKPADDPRVDSQVSSVEMDYKPWREGVEETYQWFRSAHCYSTGKP